MAAWVCKAGRTPCTRTEPCKSCEGRRNRRRGARKQAAARRGLRVPDATFSGGLAQEEAWTGPTLAEVKAGAQVTAFGRKFLSAEAQAEARRKAGDDRPFAFIAMPAGWSDGIVAVRLSDWEKHVAPKLEGDL